MKITNGKLAALAATALLALGSLTGCGDEGQEAPATVEYAAEDCDPEDLAGYEQDCGYWDGVSGDFILWYWVIPGLGGTAPAGWDASRNVPQSGTLTRPANAKLVPPKATQPKPPGAPAPKAPAPRVVAPAPAAPRVNAPAPAAPARPAAPAPAPKVGK